MSIELMAPGSSADPETIVDPLDIRARIEELKLLRDGWLDGTGTAPSSAGLESLADLFEMFYRGDAPLPYLFPTPDGRILAEWSLKPWALSLEIDLATKLGEWHALHLGTDAEESRDLDLASADDWNWLSQTICRFEAARP